MFVPNAPNILKDILPKWFYEKYMKTRKFDNYETGREKAILFGIPVSMIKGIIVSRKINLANSVSLCRVAVNIL